MNIELVKLFLKVDFNDDDDIIALMMSAAEEYIKAAVGACNYEDTRVQLLALVIITELYEKRSFTVDKAGVKAQYTMRSIIAQLQAEQEASEDEA